MTEDERRDDVVRRLLQAERPLPRHGPADWDRLARRIVAEAKPGFGALGPIRASKGLRNRSRRLGLSLALAAGLAAFLLLSRLVTSTSESAAATSAFLAALAGEVSQESVLDATLGQPGETWLLAEGRQQ